MLRKLRKVVPFALAVSLTVVSAGAPGQAVEAASADKKPVTIRFWNWWDQFREPWMRKIIADFQKKYPWITVKNEIQPWGDRQSKVLAALLGGAPPDLIMATRQEVVELADKGAIIPITRFIKERKVNLDLFYRAEVVAFQWKGEQWTLPMPTVSGNDDMIIYNKGWFDEAGMDPEKPPQTWRQLDDYNKKLTERSGDGRIKRLGVRVSPQQFISLLYSNNGQALSSDGRQALFASPEGIETLESLAKRLDSIGGNAAQSPVLFGGAKHPFYEEKEAIVFENVSIFSTIPQFAPKGFEWGVGSNPYNDRNPKAKSVGVAAVQFGWGYVIPRAISPQKQEAAYLFLEFLTTDAKGTGIFMLQQSRPSPVKKFNQNPKYYEINPNWKDVLKALETDVPFPVTPLQSRIVPMIWQAAERAYSGTAPRQALEQAEQAVQRLLDAYWKKAK